MLKFSRFNSQQLQAATFIRVVTVHLICMRFLNGDVLARRTQLKTYEEIKNLAQDRHLWRACTTACQPSIPEDDS